MIWAKIRWLFRWFRWPPLKFADFSLTGMNPVFILIESYSYESSFLFSHLKVFLGMRGEIFMLFIEDISEGEGIQWKVGR